MRRRAELVVAAALIAACGTDPAAPTRPRRSTYDEAGAIAARRACLFDKGAEPGLSIAATAPLGDEIPVDTVIVLVFDGRSFDHLLGELPGAGMPDVVGPPADAMNLDRDLNPVYRAHAPLMCSDDTAHDWTATHLEWDGGFNDGFVSANAYGANDPTGARAMSYYGPGDLPGLYAVARTFAVADWYFSSAMGPSNPNRAFLYTGSAHGRVDDTRQDADVATLFDALDAAGVRWTEYYGSELRSSFLTRTFLRHWGTAAFAPLDQFFTDAAQGTLPPVVFLDPSQSGGATREDGHAPGDVQLMDALLLRVVDAVEQSPAWGRSALFITFDQAGGLYDHVPPPWTCVPDAVEPEAGGFGYDQSGLRVPFVLVSPWAKPGFVSHRQYDHTSITRFLETRFLLPALTARDANADPLLSMFDFTTPSLQTPPPLPQAVVNEAALAACKALYPAP